MRFLVRLRYVARKGQEPQVGVKCGMLPPLLAKVLTRSRVKGFSPRFLLSRFSFVLV